MRPLFVRDLLFVIALSSPASLLACFSDSGDPTGAVGATMSTGTMSAGSSTGESATASETGTTTAGTTTTAGKTTHSTMSTMDTLSTDTSTGAGTTGDTTGAPTRCMPEEMAEPCPICVLTECCDPYIPCAADEMCVCYIVCLGLGGTEPECSENCRVDPNLGVTQVMMTCIKGACDDVCKTG